VPFLASLRLEPFQEFAAILLIAAALGGVATLLKQPLIVAFIAVGIIVGPAALDLASQSEPLELLASLGVSVLLFLVGLRLDLTVIRTMGLVSLATGLGQVAFTSVIGFGICLLLGLDVVASVYVAVALTFSSTIIIVKLLSDKREIDALHGKIAVGFLIVQDIVVVIAMVALSAFGAVGTHEAGIAPVIGSVLLKAAALLAVVFVMMKFLLPALTGLMARHQELLVLFAVAWAVTLSAGSEYAGFSREVGAFLAGVSLASTPFRDSIGGRLVSLRDFMLLFFFINLGQGLDLGQIQGDFAAALVLSLFVLVGNPIIVMVIMGAMGYRKRTGFLAGLTVAQISEFSLILAALGVSLGHIQPHTMGLITLVGLITIGLSTYLILYSHPLYDRLAPLLNLFEKRTPSRETNLTCPAMTDVIILGLGRFGSGLSHHLEARGMRVLGVDFDPQLVRQWHAHGRMAQYGDAEDPELASSLPLSHARWVVSTIPHVRLNVALLNMLREQSFTGLCACTAHSHHDVERLRAAGAALVLLPFADAAKEASDRIAGLDPRRQAKA